VPYATNGNNKSKKIEIPSEVLVDWLDSDNHINRLLNSTCGIWFYERDLFNKSKLKKELLALIKEIDKIKGFYWEKDGKLTPFKD
jgi:hypothetical protein